MAIAAFHGNEISPQHLILTPGTSLAYFYLFRLLARDHSEILCPAPTYPLFDDLARIAGLQVRRYHLDQTTDAHGTTRWIVDPNELKFQITPRTCAIVLVSPHNPTGTVISNAEMESISEIANAAGLPLIMDEVFRTYTLHENTAVPRPSELGCRLSFTLNGLSKSHYLPGLKAGWIAVEGENAATTPILHALEYLSDSFLPVQEITQAAIPGLLAARSLIEVNRLSALQRAACASRMTQSPQWHTAHPQAGPYVCITQTNPVITEDTMVDDLLENHGALFHPGHLYSFPEPCLVATIYNQSQWPNPSEILHF